MNSVKPINADGNEYVGTFSTMTRARERKLHSRDRILVILIIEHRRLIVESHETEQQLNHGRLLIFAYRSGRIMKR